MQSIRPPDKFNMVDMEGIDILFSYGENIPGLYQKLVESITPCRYQCLYNWYFDGVLIPPTYVELTVNQDTNDIWINGGAFVTSYDRVLLHIPSLETASGSIVYITDALSRRVEELICYINPLQIGSGEPSPNNIRPISGHLAVNVYDEETYDASAIPKLTVNWQTEVGTIYSSTVTFNDDGSADVVVDMAIKSDTWSNFTNEASVGNFIRRQISISDRQGNYGNRERTISNIAQFVSSINDNSVHVSMASSGNYLYAILPSTVSQDQVITIVYPIATPQTYHFDNIGELYTRLGTNIIWHDANGDISVTYWKE